MAAVARRPGPSFRALLFGTGAGAVLQFATRAFRLLASRSIVFLGGSSLPFAMLQNYPKLPKPSPAAPGRHSGRGRVFLHVRAGCHPWLWSVCRRFKLAVCQASKLPETAQTLPCSSWAPIRPRQTLPAPSTRPSRRWHWLFSSVQCAVCKHAKLAHACVRAASQHARGGRQPSRCCFFFVFAAFFSGTCHCVF